MLNSMTEQARKVLSLAADEARALSHHFVGTEHILLGLLLEGSCDAGGTLQRLGLNADSMRSEIEKLVHRGPQMQLPDELPLTPRAKRVIQFASEEAMCVGLSQVVPEHLLIGLIREPDGVAGQVMKNLGLQIHQVRAEALKIRLLQVRLVERAVRPVRAGIKHKRKMREELLAHLTGIYQDELANANDPFAAMDAAAKRFGDPAELTRELQNSVPIPVRRDFYVQRWIGWRAPESVVSMMARTSAVSLGIVALLVGLPILVGILIQGWNYNQFTALRIFAGLAIMTPAAQFGLGLCYYKMRDSLWGVFGSRRSRINAVLWAVVAAIVVLATEIGFIASARAAIVIRADSFSMMCFIAASSAIALLLLARLCGLKEIRDTIWATLDLNATS